MTFIHPHMPRLRRRRTPRVIDGDGFPVDRELPPELTPAANFLPQDPPHTTPTQLPTQQDRSRTRTVHERPMTWEERLSDMAAFWDHIGERLAGASQYTAAKTRFDVGVITRWSDALRVWRVGSDRDQDSRLLADQYAVTGTREMAGLQRAITQRILADALAGGY